MTSFHNAPFAPSRWPFFYGYMILVGATLGTIMSAPGQTIGVSVFTDHLIDSAGISRLWISIAYGVGTIGSSLIIGRTGRLLDTIGVRIIGTIAAAGLGLVLVLMSRIDRVAAALSSPFGPSGRLVVTFAVMTVAFLFLRYLGQGVLTLASRTMLMRWFDRRRGTVNAVMGAFIALTFSGAPLAFELLIRRWGWRGAWVLLGVLEALGMALFALVFFRNDPHACGLQPDGAGAAAREGGEESGAVSWTLPQARRTVTFWAFNLGLAMFSLVVTAVTFHVVSVFETGGLDRVDAISIFLPASIISVTINVVAGIGSDHPWVSGRLKWLLCALLAGMALSCTGALSFSLRSGIGRWLLIAGNGIAGGFFGLLSAIVWPRYFGTAHLGAIGGYNMSFMVFSSAVGPPLFGASFSLLGTYDSALMLSLAAIGILFPFALRADKPASSGVMEPSGCAQAELQADIES
ncbi:MAG: MFS transporter [Chitinivibrionales bacterium]|nr:MFS transporter [Chitinivibrionales bacterium]